MNTHELLTLFLAEEKVLGKGKNKKKVNAKNIAELIPCLIDILDNKDEKALAIRLQSIFEDHHKHLAERITSERQRTLDALFFDDNNEQAVH